MRWFGFGFNSFAQICVPDKSDKEESGSAVGQEKVCVPVDLVNHRGRSKIRASWSRRASLFLDDVNLPLVPGGYISSKPPIFRSLSSHLQAKSLALGGEHAVLLTAAGAVYTWGQGSHGQLGHGGLISEEEPRTVEALWGMTMRSVAAGGWHSICVGDGGDLYVWGWNESGQLGLPSRGLRKASQQKGDQQAVFISIQAFPALVDVSPSCEISTVSCGSRHTAAVTTTGYLYTWGWGEYGQLGHQTTSSLDEPQCVEFFRNENLHVVDVVCGSWNTFTAAVKKEVLGLENVPELPPVSTGSELWTTC
uniref:RCC1 domain containing 1 n=1 Tax=Poecilia mexicana TaxID=48701 RepID=A0A3B3YBT6_9TELE